jgi:hypothetical protein
MGWPYCAEAMAVSAGGETVVEDARSAEHYIKARNGNFFASLLEGTNRKRKEAPWAELSEILQKLKVDEVQKHKSTWEPGA